MRTSENRHTIGVYPISSQSGHAFLADYLTAGHEVYGYVRETEHGLACCDQIRRQHGIWLERPQNRNREQTHLIEVKAGTIGTDARLLVQHCDVIVLALPAVFHLHAVRDLKDAGILEKRIPIVLAPARTFASPYIWRELGEGYPLVCLSTLPYSCKTPNPGVSYIKRRKRVFFASMEGSFTPAQVELVTDLFPQAVLTPSAAVTSLGNIGAVLHPCTYLMNDADIRQARAEGRMYPFYMDGIAARHDVGEALYLIDQTRLKIASAYGLEVFGLEEAPRNDEWFAMMRMMREREAMCNGDIGQLRAVRRDMLHRLRTSIISLPCWLDCTYGVERIVGESVSDVIRRTPTYQRYSVPQERYVLEDIPTGVIPMRSMAKLLGVDTAPLDKVLSLNERYYGKITNARDLTSFDDAYIRKYMTESQFKLICEDK